MARGLICIVMALVVFGKYYCCYDVGFDYVSLVPYILSPLSLPSGAEARKERRGDCQGRKNLQ